MTPKTASRRGPPSPGEMDPAVHERLRRLRAERDTDDQGQLLLVTMRFRIPDEVWTGPFSRAHPSLRLEAINRTEVDEHHSVSDYWIAGHSLGALASEIAAFPDVQAVESLAEVGNGCLYRVTYTNPPILYLYRKLRLPIQFPLRMQAGFLVWEVCARRTEFQAVLDFARSRRREFTIASIRRQPLTSHLPTLTAGQQDLLTRAMALGYFAVPRGITLTALAKKLGRSKSGLSESIAIIEKKLLETAMRTGIPAG